MTCRAACCQANYDRGLADAAPRVRLTAGMTADLGEVHLSGPGGWMTAYSGPAADARRMAAAFARTLGVTVT